MYYIGYIFSYIVLTGNKYCNHLKQRFHPHLIPIVYTMYIYISVGKMCCSCKTWCFLCSWIILLQWSVWGWC